MDVDSRRQRRSCRQWRRKFSKKLTRLRQSSSRGESLSFSVMNPSSRLSSRVFEMPQKFFFFGAIARYCTQLQLECVVVAKLQKEGCQPRASAAGRLQLVVSQSSRATQREVTQKPI